MQDLVEEEPGSDNVTVSLEMYLTPDEDTIVGAIMFLRGETLEDVASHAMTTYLEANYHGDPAVAAAVALRQEVAARAH